MYLPLGSNNEGVDTLLAWMSLHFLYLIETKIEIIIFESSDVAISPVLKLGHWSSCVKPLVKSLVVNFDIALKCDKHIKTAERRVLGKAKPFLYFRTLKGLSMLLFQQGSTLVTPFIWVLFKV